MATFKSPVFGKISGKYGDALATYSKATGKNYLRVATVPSNPRTEKQVAHRAKFGFVNSVLVPFYPVFKRNFGGNRGIRYAISIAFRECIIGEYPDFELDMSKIPISEGNLYTVSNPSIEKISTGKLKAEWDTTILEGSDPHSHPVLVFFSEELNQVYSIIGDISLTDGSYEFDMPEIWNDNTIHAWLYFISEDSLKKSNSQYLGSLIQ